MSLETWTLLRFSMYPIMLVCGAGVAVLFRRQYQQSRCVEQAWAFWLALAVAVQGLAGFTSLLMAQPAGFNSRTSGVFTAGTVFVTMVTVSALLALSAAAWRRR